MKPNRKSRFNFSIIKAETGAGLGLKTHDEIPRGVFVIEYFGPILKTEQANKNGGKYLFEINSKYTINGSPRYNLARYINHSCLPNCETDVVGRKIYIYAKRKIKKNEELTYDYGKEYFDDFIKKIGCRCVKCRKK